MTNSLSFIGERNPSSDELHRFQNNIWAFFIACLPLFDLLHCIKSFCFSGVAVVLIILFVFLRP